MTASRILSTATDTGIENPSTTTSHRTTSSAAARVQRDVGAAVEASAPLARAKRRRSSIWERGREAEALLVAPLPHRNYIGGRSAAGLKRRAGHEAGIIGAA